MSLALETYQNEGKHLSHSEQTLKSEGFYRKHTVSSCKVMFRYLLSGVFLCRCLCVVIKMIITEISISR